MKKIERKTKRTTSGRVGAAKVVAAKTSSTKVSANSENNLSLAEIKTLIELISDKQFNEFELERGDFRLRLSKGTEKIAASQIAVEPVRIVEQAVVASTASPAVQVVSDAATPLAAAPVAQEENLHIVTSPIVGTFYGSPSPTAKPFVVVGDAVESGKVLCIVEAMKLMNEIQSDANGVIAKVFVESGQPVEYGQALFGIKK
jgi:acetyl-CoA carboxylase biotin carboxyl carrier protein